MSENNKQPHIYSDLERAWLAQITKDWKRHSVRNSPETALCLSDAPCEEHFCTIRARSTIRKCGHFCCPWQGLAAQFLGLISQFPKPVFFQLWPVVCKSICKTTSVFRAKWALNGVDTSLSIATPPLLPIPYHSDPSQLPESPVRPAWVRQSAILFIQFSHRPPRFWFSWFQFCKCQLHSEMYLSVEFNFNFVWKVSQHCGVGGRTGVRCQCVNLSQTDWMF